MALRKYSMTYCLGVYGVKSASDRLVRSSINKYKSDLSVMYNCSNLWLMEFNQRSKPA